MNPKLDKALCEKYPLIFAKRNGLPSETLMSFGFECGDGWYNIIDALCNCIQTYIKYAPNIPQVVALQVKEKYGTLRFYIHGGDPYIDGMITMAEAISGRTCEICGNPGKIMGESWLKTRCEEHYAD